MISKIKTFILSFSALILFAVPVAVPVASSSVFADTTSCPAGQTCPDIQNQTCAGANSLQIPTGDNNAANPNQCPTTTGGTDTVNKLIRTVLNVLSVLIGLVAVVMIIVGGFHYVTSGGSDEKVKKAKNTLLYAIIGLVVVALAQVIVKFVLDKAING